MKSLLIILFSFISISLSYSQTERIISRIDSTKSPELVLIQELTIKASIADVWDAYTTKQGWESWASPIAEIDLKVNGIIKTNYNKAGKIGDATTNVLHIINYVPYKLLTLQAEITENFPEFMKADEKDFYNVIHFNENADGTTSVQSYGIGYKNSQKYLNLMAYFIPANEMSLMNLIVYLEEGKVAEH